MNARSFAVSIVGGSLLVACAVGSRVEESDPTEAPAPSDLPAASSSVPRATEPPTTKDAATTSPIADAATPDANVARDANVEDATTGAARRPSAGDLVISEVAYDPPGAEPEGEWFEVANVATVPLELRGLVLRDGAARTHTVASSVVVAPGAFVVLARSSAAAIAGGVPATAIGYAYGAGVASQSGIILANGTTGAIEIASGSTVIARVPYGSFGLAATATSLDVRSVTYEASPRATSFCVASTPTPGAAPACR